MATKYIFIYEGTTYVDTGVTPNETYYGGRHYGFDDQDVDELAAANRIVAGGGGFDVTHLFASGNPIGLSDGSAATPAIFPNSDPDTGFYFPAVGQIGVAVAGVLRATFAATALTLTTPIAIANGSAAAPALHAAADTNTGLFWSGSDVLGVAIGGAEALRVNSSRAVLMGRTTELPGGGHSIGNISGAPALALYRGTASLSNEILELYSNVNGSTTRCFTVMADGHVMIGGTGDPTGALHVDIATSIIGVNISNSANPAELKLAGGGSGYTHAHIEMVSTGSSRGQGLYLLNTANSSEWFVGSAYNDTDAFYVTRRAGASHADSSADQANRLLELTHEGHLGIGVAPTVALDIDGDTLRLRSSKTPASASATGAVGEICWDSSYVYICTATDTWKRAALASW